MKRYTIHAPCNDQYEEDPEGEWVTYEDANAWWHEMKELPRIQDVIEIVKLKEELAELKAKFAGPRCEVCGGLCIDLAKDEDGQCPDCSRLGREIAAAGVHS